MFDNQDDYTVSSVGGFDSSGSRSTQWESPGIPDLSKVQISPASVQTGDDEISSLNPDREPDDTVQISRELNREGRDTSRGSGGKDALKAFGDTYNSRTATPDCTGKKDTGTEDAGKKDSSPSQEKAPSGGKGTEQAKERLEPQAKKYQKYVDEAAQKYGMDPSLINAVIKHESGFNPDAESPMGAQGLMQLMPETADMLGVNDPNDPRQAIMGGTKYLKQLNDRFEGDIKKTIAAYNAGPGNVERYKGIPPFAETKKYVENVFSTFNEYRGM
ncbi:MAG: lytic transglycosylase domain-containing protein [Candidatus Xenobiia bacterium LiM19]